MMKKQLKSPLGRVLGLGSAKRGVEHWWAQRVSAVLVAVLGLWFLGYLWSMETYTYQVFFHSWKTPLSLSLMILFVMASLYHGALGLQIVIEDYVHCAVSRTLLLVGVKLFSFFGAILGIVSLLSVALL